MTMTQTPRATGESLFERVKNILLRPKLEWDRIDPEPATIPGLYTGYICILAAIGPICGASGRLAFGISVPGFGVWHVSAVAIISSAVVHYLLSLVSVAVLALIIDMLAPTFAGQRNRIQAFKVAAYSATASWLAGVFLIVPALALLSVVGVYSLYLLYLGLPRLMKAPQDKALAYTALVIVAAIVLEVVIAMLIAPLGMLGYTHPTAMVG